MACPHRTPMQSLVDSWEKFAVPHDDCRQPSIALEEPSVLQSFYCRELCSQLDARDVSLAQQHLASSSAVLPFSRDDQTQVMERSSNLWLLSLVSHNRELMRAVSRLFVQFGEQYTDAVDEHRQKVEQLQATQEMQLASLLNVDSDVSTDMIVNSSVTEHLVLQHQQAMEALLAECTAQERALESELQHSFFALLGTSAPDALAALAAKSAEVEEAISSNNNRTGSPSQGRRLGSPRTGGGDGGSSPDLTDSWVDMGESGRRSSIGAGELQYKAEADVSRFAARYPRNRAELPVEAVAPATSSAPVRTVVLANPNPSPKPLQGHKASDAASRAIVLDLSPTSWLRDCMISCGNRSSPVVAAAAEEHLMRLAHAKHAMLFLVGSTKAATELVQGISSPELLLGGKSRHDDVFVPLPGEPHLRVLFTTRFWGANILVLWDPTSPTAAAAEGASPEEAKQQPLCDGPAALGPIVVVESVLRLAFSWNVDMFSLAVLASGGGGSSGGTAISLSVLALLRDAVASILMENTHNRSPQLWTMQDEELLSRRYWSETSAPSCPRAVGVRYVGVSNRGERVYVDAAAAAAAAAAASSMAGAGGTAQRYRRPPATMGMAAAGPKTTPSDAVPKRAASVPVTLSSPKTVPLPPQVYFNTPMAIRVFLPLPESYFTASRGDGDAGMAETQDSSLVGHTAARHGPPPAPPPHHRHHLPPSTGSAPSSTRGSLVMPPRGPSSSSSLLGGSPRHGMDGAPTHREDSDGSDDFSSSFVTHLRRREPKDRAEPPTLAEVMRHAFGDGATVY